MTDDGQFMAAAGSNSILPKEHGGQFSSLPIIRYLDNEDIGAIAAWDSSIHDSLYLNRVTEANERIYLILKATVSKLVKFLLRVDTKFFFFYFDPIGPIVTSFANGSHFTQETRN